MKIYGIGTDIVDIKRIEKSLIGYGSKFKKRVFLKREILYCDKKKNPIPFYAKRFAAKEALSKALGVGIRKGISFKNIEVKNDNLGKPFIKLNGAAEIFLKKRIKNKKYSVHLSLSDETLFAQAFVLISIY
jgi:holo-[acyl-carrier protein] synthase